jgi:hypothetical protein
VKPGERDYISANAELSKTAFKTHLTKEEEERCRELRREARVEGEEEGREDGPEEREGSEEAEVASRGQNGRDGPLSLERYGLTEEERKAVSAIDERLQALGRAQATHVGENEEGATREEDRSEVMAAWEEALSEVTEPASEGMSALRDFLYEERRRRREQHRLTQIDALLDEYRQMDPLTPLPTGRPSSTASRVGASARSDVSRVLSLHSARSARRPLRRADVEVVLREAREALGREPLAEEREGVNALVSKLKGAGMASAIGQDDAERAQRLAESLKRTGEILRKNAQWQKDVIGQERVSTGSGYSPDDDCIDETVEDCDAILHL